MEPFSPERPLVSVIMGVYNCSDEAGLFESIDSIIGQTYDNIELIICNDGSTDDGFTEAILKKATAIDQRIKVFSYQRNRGLAYALNYCIERSSGELIARQDADDASDQCRLEKQVGFLQANDSYSMVGCQAIVFDSGGEWGKYDVVEEPCATDFLWSNPYIHPAMIFKRHDLIACGRYRVSSETARCEDYDLFMRMHANGCTGYNLRERLFYYRIDRNEGKHRPMRTRLEECLVRKRGFRLLGLPRLRSVPYILKPVVLGIVPGSLFPLLRMKTHKPDSKDSGC